MTKIERANNDIQQYMSENDYTSKVAAMYDIIHEFYANAGFPFPEEALLAELDRMSEAQLFDTFLNTFYSSIA